MLLPSVVRDILVVEVVEVLVVVDWAPATQAALEVVVALEAVPLEVKV